MRGCLELMDVRRVRKKPIHLKTRTRYDSNVIDELKRQLAAEERISFLLVAIPTPVLFGQVAIDLRHSNDECKDTTLPTVSSQRVFNTWQVVT
jgi:hypothetical protein